MASDAPTGELALTVTRGSGRNGALKLSLFGFTTKSDRFRLLVNGREVDSGALSPDATEVSIEGADAMKVARAVATGTSFRMVDGTGAELGQLSLAGSSAALRHIDATQGRAGSSGAIVARGRKAATARTAKLPLITATRISQTNVLPDTGALVALSESSPCAEERFGSTEDVAYSLGLRNGLAQSLVMLNCGAGAYNFSSAPYIGTRDGTGKWSFAPAKFDHETAWGVMENDSINLMVNADWDPATQTISSYAKGRGLGDCGSTEQYVWDGNMFRLKAASRMEECRGSREFIPVWRADVRLTD